MTKILGYSDRISVRAGEELSVFVSCERDSFSARLIRLINGDASVDAGYAEVAIPSDFESRYPGRRQSIHPGSFAIVERPAAIAFGESFTASLFVQPTKPGGAEQVLMSCFDGERGFQLYLRDDGAPGLRLGDGASVTELSIDRPLRSSNWYLITASCDAGRQQAHLGLFQVAAGGIPLRSAHWSTQSSARHVPAAAGTALTFAARFAGRSGAGRPIGECHFNGKLEAPSLYAEALDDLDIIARLRLPSAPVDDRSLIGRWDFSSGIEGDELRDHGPNGLTGYLINLPLRAVRGWRWDGSEMNWKHRPDHYSAIHFHDDDLSDAGWLPDIKCRIPDGLRSGVYCIHIEDGETEDFVPFVVRPAARSRTASTVLLLPTASYMAYGNERCAVTVTGEVLFPDAALHDHDRVLRSRPELGASLYDRHSDGSGISISSRLRPLVNMRPKVRSWLGGTGSGVWQFNADTHLIDFLEHEGIEYDVISDEDLDREGVGAIAGYSCLLTGTHPEYASTRMMDALDGFKRGGGSLVYLGGNGFYWRVAFHAQVAGVIEVRRAEGGIRPWASPPGEYHHAFTGELGGLWQRLGRPPQSLVGVGMTAQGFDRSSPYRRTPASNDPRVAFLFEGIDDEMIGDFGLVGGGAAGSELDRADVAWGTPQHALVVARSEGHSDAYLIGPEDIYEPTRKIGGGDQPLVRADMTFFETDAGGAVFATGSIAWAGSLSHNGYANNVAQITRNVIRRFIHPTPFENPPETLESYERVN